MSLLTGHHEIPNRTDGLPTRTWPSSQPVGTKDWECGFKRRKGQTAKKQRIWEKKSESKEKRSERHEQSLMFFRRYL